jgi:hypothetical protein
MNGDVFANNVSITQDEPSGFSCIFEILRSFAQHSAGKYLVGGAQDGGPGDVDMSSNPTVWANSDVLIDHGVWSNHNRGMKFGLGVNDRSLMNHE